MRIGTSVPLPAYTIDPAFMAQKAEELGFESIWYAEHPAVPVHSASPFPATGGAIPWTYSHFTDPYVALARASGVTRTIKLGTGITLVPERNPAHRWTQTREAIEVMKALWTHDEAEYHGRYFNFPPVRSYPKPAQKPHPPIILGGHATQVLRRVVAHADGWLPNRITPAEVETSRGTLDALAQEVGRDPRSITISVYGQPPDRTLVQSLLNAGADRVVVRPEHVETEAEMGEQLERMAEAVLR